MAAQLSTEPSSKGAYNNGLLNLTLLFLIVHQAFAIRESLLLLGNFEAWYQKGTLFRQPGTMDAERLWNDQWSEKIRSYELASSKHAW